MKGKPLSRTAILALGCVRRGEVFRNSTGKTKFMKPRDEGGTDATIQSLLDRKLIRVCDSKTGKMELTLEGTNTFHGWRPPASRSSSKL